MRKIAFTIIISMLSLQTYAQTQVGDAILPNKLTFDSNELVLNGSGLREKYWFDLYACGLYLQSKNNKASTIVANDASMAIHMEILSSILSKKKLFGAFRSGVEKTNSEEVVKKINADLEKFLGFLDNDISVGDKYSISYTPNLGTSLYINNIKKGTIKGLLFKSAIFNIWLAKKPVDSNLKDKLLNK